MERVQCQDWSGGLDRKESRDDFESFRGHLRHSWFDELWAVTAYFRSKGCVLEKYVMGGWD